MKVKLDDYEVRVLINGLMQQHRSYDAETNGQIDALAPSPFACATLLKQ